MFRTLLLTTALCIAVAASASGQSGRNSIPVIGPAVHDQSVRQTQKSLGAATDLADDKAGSRNARSNDGVRKPTGEDKELDAGVRTRSR